jgi:hypothetical protein
MTTAIATSNHSSAPPVDEPARSADPTADSGLPPPAGRWPAVGLAFVADGSLGDEAAAWRPSGRWARLGVAGADPAAAAPAEFASAVEAPPWPCDVPPISRVVHTRSIPFEL